MVAAIPAEEEEEEGIYLFTCQVLHPQGHTTLAKNSSRSDNLFDSSLLPFLCLHYIVDHIPNITWEVI